MITLRQLFTVFGHDPKWQKFATASTQPMMTVYLRKLGDKDVSTLTDFDIEMQYAASDQPEDRKVKARACMTYLLTWAKEAGKPVPSVYVPPKKKAVRPQKGEIQQERRKQDIEITMEDWLADSKERRGTIEHETASNGWQGDKKRFKNDFRAVIMVNGQRYRHRGKTRTECREWLKAVTSKKILPTDNKADWLRMEQRKDESQRIDEMIASAAEEADIVYDYRRTGDTTTLFDYVTKRLLPHMMYYCAHTLRMTQEKSLSLSRQAVGVLLTRIVGGRPITNITFTCKHMLRIHQNRGDFWYYEKAPEDVKMMVNRIDFAPLAELWKLTKDKRI